MSDSPICFAVYTLPQAGFTDQLAQFTVAFKLGRSLSYVYVHTPLQATRSSSCTFDFVGINDYWKRMSVSFERFQLLDLPISDETFVEHHLSSFEDLRKYVTAVVANEVAQTTVPLLVRFDLSSGRRGFFGTINCACPNLPNGIDLIDIYREARRLEPRKSLFQSNRTKVLVHMRQGDTGIVETPWHTYIPVWACRPTEYFQEFDRYDAVSNDHIEIEHFYDFIQAFKMHLADPISFVFCSDGYGTTFQHLSNNIDRLNLNESRIRLLRQMGPTYDERKFRSFKEFPDSVCQVGENDENFFDLINSAVEADIIVTGTQQTMMVQFAAQFYDLKKPKIMIILHRGGELPNRGWHNLSEEKAALIPVNLCNYKIEEVATHVRNQLAKINSKL